MIVIPARAAMSELPQLKKAASLLQEGSLNKAIQLLRRLTEDHPKNGAAYLLLGSSLSMIPQRDEAIKYLLRGLDGFINEMEWMLDGMKHLVCQGSYQCRSG